MAELKYSKLKLKVDNSVKSKEIETEGGKFTLEVKQYLPQIDKIRLVSNVVKLSFIDGFVRQDFIDFILYLEIVKEYTNLSFTAKKLDDISLYDELESNGIIDEVISLMDGGELDDLIEWVGDYALQMKNISVSGSSGFVAQKAAMSEAISTIVEGMEESAE